MNIGGGEAADQLVRMMLSFGEVSVRLGGSALKNMLALTMALAKNNKTISGKINLGRMLRETRDLRQFPMTPEQYRQFSKLAKKQKILFSAIRDKDDQGKLIDVILPVTELDRANMIFERIKYVSPEQDASRQERRPRKKRRNRLWDQWRPLRWRLLERWRPWEKWMAKSKTVDQKDMDRPERETPQKERESPQERQKEKDKATDPTPSEGPKEKPVDFADFWNSREHQEKEKSRQEAAPPKKDSPSQRASPGTRSSSSSRSKAGPTTRASDRPSVEGRLKAYRGELDRKRRCAPVKSKNKTRPKSR